MKPELGNLYWRISYDCNANCFMCLREHSGKEIRGYEHKLLEEAKELGFKTIVVTGGEPTLREDLPDLIRASAEKGFNTRLDTNGILLDRKYLEAIKGSLYMIGFPLHGSTAELHDSITGLKGHFDIIKYKAAIARELSIPLKITTALSRRNINDAENIAVYLASEIKPNIFGLTGLVKRVMTPELFESERIPKEEFDEMKQKLMKKKYPFKLSFCSGHKDSDGAYFFVNPDFTVNITRGDSEKKILDFKTERLELMFQRADIDFDLHMRRFKETNL